MKRNRREHGRILSVETKTRGSALAGDYAAGVTEIAVDDAGDFDEDGGWLYVGTQTVEYLSCDDDTGTIVLADPLTDAGDQGDPVEVWSDLYDEVVDFQEALVELDGEYDNPDPVIAEVAEGVGELPEGDRGKAGESCTLKRVADDEWEVVGVGGRPAKSKGIRFEADDFHTLTAGEVAAGSATFTLTHRPMKEGLTAVCGGAPQRPGSYTIDYDAQTITWPLSGFEKTGDVIWVHYAYRKGLPRPRLVATTTGTASYDVPITAPAANEGDLLVLAVLLADGNSVSALNGYTELGVSAAVTKTVAGFADSYRLGMYSRTCPAGAIPVPTFTGAVRDSPWAMAAVTGKATNVTGSAVATAPDTHTANAPALPDTMLRVYGVLGLNPIVTASGTTVAENVTDRTGPDDQVTVVIKVDSSGDAATVSTTDGTNKGEWMLGSIAIGAGA